MAVSRESLETAYDQSAVLRFPTASVRRRAAAQRRGRAIRRTAAGGALAATLFLVLLGGGGGGAGTAEASRSQAPRAVVVRSGQTVWDLAERYAPPSMDPRVYVDRVLQLNHLKSAPAAGVRIRLPH
jgi:LysM domain